MTADLLRRAGNEMRAVWAPGGIVRDHPDASTWLAVADLLGMAADHAAGRGKPCQSCMDYTERIARLYLGETS